MPLNILSTQLLKALATYDIELAIKLGALELAPEDMGLLSYVCPSKYDYQSLLQENLDLIYKEFKWDFLPLEMQSMVLNPIL